MHFLAEVQMYHHAETFRKLISTQFLQCSVNVALFRTRTEIIDNLFWNAQKKASKFDEEFIKNRSEIKQKSIKNQAKIHQQSIKNRPTIHQKSSKNRSKIDPISIKNRSWAPKGLRRGLGSLSGSLRACFWRDLEAVLAPRTAPRRSQNPPKINAKINQKFDAFWERILNGR